MKRLFTAVLLLLSMYSLAQSPETIKLQKQILQHPQQDTFRVNRLNYLSALSSMSLGSRDSAASEALAISKRLDYSNGIIKALINLSSLKLSEGKNAEAMSMLTQANTIAETQKDKENQVAVLEAISNLKQQTNESKTAINELLKAEAIATGLPDKKLLAECQRIIGDFYNLSEVNYPLAMEWILKSMKTADEADCASCREKSWYTLGSIYSSLGDHEKALQYFQKLMDANKSSGTINPSLLIIIGESYRLTGKYHEAIKSYEEALVLDKQPYTKELVESNMADVYVRMDSLPKAFHYAFSSLKGAEKLKDVTGVAWIDGILARAYLKQNHTDSALYYAKKGLGIATENTALEYMRDNSEALANAYLQKKDFKNAYHYNTLYISYRDSMLNENVSNQANLLQYNYNKEKTEAQIDVLNQQKKNQRSFLIAALVFLALIFVTALLLFRNNRQKQKANKLLHKQKQEIDEKATELAKQKDNVELLSEIGRKITSSLSVEKIISTAYDNVNLLMDANVFGIGIYNDALKQLEFPATYENGQPLPFYTNEIEDKNRFGSVCFSKGEEIIIGNLNDQYQDHVQHVPTPRAGDQPVSVIFLPLKVKGEKLGVITVQSFKKNAYSEYHLFMLRNIATYTAIAIDNAESYEKLNHTVNSLQSTQKQLIQSEKMASLGELTAGIAHEIQNPLNFVNNFSDVNKELLEELKEELAIGNQQEAISIANDVIENEEKISHHGKRADAIVKGMLQHSRKSSGQKEPTDMNALADEYLRLSYHGLRAKDKAFNATMQTDFDSSIGKINVISQDMGRVILNLFNNAFYAVGNKKKTNGFATGEKYEPTVSVSTKRIDGHISIHVKDNGNGIPQDMVDKIFQPFFTTKPTGEGTGLGLSLAYDIVKAHGGELKVESTENEGSEFVIQLPVV